MTIQDFMNLSLEAEWTYVSIWTCNRGMMEYQGLYIDMPDEFLSLKIKTWNLMQYETKHGLEPCICFNVEMEI